MGEESKACSSKMCDLAAIYPIPLRSPCDLCDLPAISLAIYRMRSTYDLPAIYLHGLLQSPYDLPAISARSQVRLNDLVDGSASHSAFWSAMAPDGSAHRDITFRRCEPISVQSPCDLRAISV